MVRSVLGGVFGLHRIKVALEKKCDISKDIEKGNQSDDVCMFVCESRG